MISFEFGVIPFGVISFEFGVISFGVIPFGVIFFGVVPFEFEVISFEFEVIPGTIVKVGGALNSSNFCISGNSGNSCNSGIFEVESAAMWGLPDKPCGKGNLSFM